MLGNVVLFRNMNSSERSTVIEGIKEDWMSDRNNEKFNSLPFIPHKMDGH